MILYHFSDTCYPDELLPNVGSRRHEAEDSRAVGNPVVWLTDSTDRAPGIENQGCFRHEVEVDENDPNLFKDESEERLKGGYQSEFPGRADSVRGMATSYFYTEPIKVKSVEQIDYTQNE
jgi:hypothetical protein